ncbi:MAG: hemerythrin family protein [Bacteroidales bacterium]|nr:hemerythrin family protein [Bacteroidales bacterium]
MALYEWKDVYNIGIDSIDAEHQGMLNLINQLFDAMSHGKAKEIMVDIFSELINYIKLHFKREETFFTDTNFPEYIEHKLQHDLFIEKINAFKTQFDDGKQNISVELINFLTDWLINHIFIMDRNYLNHFKKHGVN